MTPFRRNCVQCLVGLLLHQKDILKDVETVFRAMTQVTFIALLKLGHEMNWGNFMRFHSRILYYLF